MTPEGVCGRPDRLLCRRHEEGCRCRRRVGEVAGRGELAGWNTDIAGMNPGVRTEKLRELEIRLVDWTRNRMAEPGIRRRIAVAEPGKTGCSADPSCR